MGGEQEKTARRHVGVGADTHDTEPALRYGLMYDKGVRQVFDPIVARSWFSQKMDFAALFGDVKTKTARCREWGLYFNGTEPALRYISTYAQKPTGLLAEK